MDYHKAFYPFEELLIEVTLRPLFGDDDGANDSIGSDQNFLGRTLESFSRQVITLMHES